MHAHECQRTHASRNSTHAMRASRPVKPVDGHLEALTPMSGIEVYPKEYPEAAHNPQFLHPRVRERTRRAVRRT
eukprot:4197182-Pleurochrysis_carterae.AAC.1